MPARHRVSPKMKRPQKAFAPPTRALIQPLLTQEVEPMKQYPNGRALAILAGVAATLGAIGLLLADAITTGHYTTDHALVPLVVGITIAAGHLTGAAVRSRKYGSALAFVVAFLVGTAITVMNGAGRQAEGQETKIAAAELTNAAITTKQAELATANQRLTYAEAQMESEQTGQRCGERCKRWEKTASDRRIVVKALETELAALGPAKPVNAKAEKVAAIAEVLGGNHDRVKAGVTLIEPVMVPFLLEWVAIFALGYGLAHSGKRQPSQPHQRATEPAPATVSNDNGCPPPKGGTRTTVAHGNRATVASRARAEADVVRIVARGEQLPNQDELASRWGIHKGTASKWLAEFERRGLVTRARDGRSKRIAAA